MARKYRKRLSDGTIPSGDRAWCVHCDFMHENNYADNPNSDDLMYVGAEDLQLILVQVRVPQ